MSNSVAKPTSPPPADLYLAFHGRVIDPSRYPDVPEPDGCNRSTRGERVGRQAEQVEIAVPEALTDDAAIIVRDTGSGMTFEQCQSRFLDVGRNPRR